MATTIDYNSNEEYIKRALLQNIFKALNSLSNEEKKLMGEKYPAIARVPYIDEAKLEFYTRGTTVDALRNAAKLIDEFQVRLHHGEFADRLTTAVSQPPKAIIEW